MDVEWWMLVFHNQQLFTQQWYDPLELTHGCNILLRLHQSKEKATKKMSDKDVFSYIETNCSGEQSMFFWKQMYKQSLTLIFIFQQHLKRKAGSQIAKSRKGEDRTYNIVVE